MMPIFASASVGVAAMRTGFPVICLRRSAGVAPVHVLEANDVVLAAVTTGLHFNQFQRLLARVFQAMLAAQRDVGAFVFTQQEYFFAAGDPRRAIHHDPVFGAMVVHMQAECSAWFDNDPLDLEAVAAVDAVVAAPGAATTAS